MTEIIASMTLGFVFGLAVSTLLKGWAAFFIDDMKWRRQSILDASNRFEAAKRSLDGTDGWCTDLESAPKEQEVQGLVALTYDGEDWYHEFTNPIAWRPNIPLVTPFDEHIT